ncbi:MAG: AAA family ATPase [Syntrophaceae bacterium]
MYEIFYGLKEKPFEITPDPDFFFASENHKEGLANLKYAIKEGKSFTVLTGEVGSGKTILIRKLLNQLNGVARTTYIFNPIMNRSDFLEFICRDLGVEVPEGLSDGKLVSALHEFLLQCYERREKVFLIIDEAQAMDPDLLDLVRMLTNLETSKSKLLNVILMGQPELTDILNTDRFRPLKQRVTVRFDLKPLTREETAEYILYRIKRARSRDLRIFDKGSIDEIFRYSKGIPRLINVICDNALLTGFARGAKRLNKGVIRDVIRELDVSNKPKSENRAKLHPAMAFLAAAVVIMAIVWGYHSGILKILGEMIHG